MSDILTRLEYAAADKRKDTWGLYGEAAAEIKRLRQAIEGCKKIPGVTHEQVPFEGEQEGSNER